MSWLEFIEKTISHVAWPAIGLTFILLYRKPIAALIPRLKSAKIGALEAVLADLPPQIVEHLDVEKLGSKSPAARVVSSNSGGPNGFKLYSNGVMVQRTRICLLPGRSKTDVVFPLSMINEPTSIQSLGGVDIKVESWRAGGCTVTFPPSNEERSVELVITGL